MDRYEKHRTEKKLIAYQRNGFSRRSIEVTEGIGLLLPTSHIGAQLLLKLSGGQGFLRITQSAMDS